jgi:hypothetical protein
MHQYFCSFSTLTGPLDFHPNFLAFFKLIKVNPIFRTCGLQEADSVKSCKGFFFISLRLHTSLLSLT